MLGWAARVLVRLQIFSMYKKKAKEITFNLISFILF